MIQIHSPFQVAGPQITPAPSPRPKAVKDYVIENLGAILVSITIIACRLL